MTNDADITCATASGKSLEELSRLIALRSERLGELTKDAVVAAAIDVLISLRSDTRDARTNRSAGVPRRIRPRPDLFISFSGGSNPSPCLRIGSPRGPHFKQGSFFFAERGMDLKTLKVFEIVSEHECIKPYFVAAPSEAVARRVEARDSRRRIATKGGLAKTALGVAMAKISTRNTADNPPRVAKILASKLSSVQISEEGYNSGSFSLEYRDDLDYGVAALKSGAGSMDIALQKAANKIAGMINHAAHKSGDFEHDIATPFPDIKRRR